MTQDINRVFKRSPIEGPVSIKGETEDRILVSDQ